MPVGPRRPALGPLARQAPAGDLAAAYAKADLLLVLASLDPAQGGEHLATWAADVVAVVRFQEIFGFGISNSSFNGLPIDSNWLSSYQEQGLLGATLCAVILLFLLLAASFQPSGARRALALFLVTYCLVASFTEDGFTDATPYLLDLAVAASLLMTPIPWRRRPP